MKTFTFRRAAGAFLVLLVLGVGCASKGRPRIHGKVTLNGQPLADRMLTLFGGEGVDVFSQSVPILTDGSFSGEVPAPGTYKVVIQESLAAQEGNKPSTPDSAPVPPKYRDPATSDLTWTIEPGNNHRDFNLTP
jgi:hypothetical protein